jgi:hypothetical protein
MCLDTWMQLCNCITSFECRLSLKRCGPSVSIILNVLQWNMKRRSCYVISVVLHGSRIMDSILAHCLAWQLLQGFKSTWNLCIILSLFSSCADGNAWHSRPVYPESNSIQPLIFIRLTCRALECKNALNEISQWECAAMLGLPAV